MKTTGNTVLITGGSAGIGFQLAKHLDEAGNTVLITGRNEARLKEAVAKLRHASYIVGDISNETDTRHLVEQIYNNFPDLNMVINNAGYAQKHDIAESGHVTEIASHEMNVNYLSVVRLNEALLPLLKQQPEAAIVNVSSIVAIVPGQLTTYSASKAAVHSYTQSLRLALKETHVRVFELMPPLVDTELSASIGGSKGIKPEQVAREFMVALANDQFEIRVGRTQDLYELFRKSPEAALEMMHP